MRTMKIMKRMMSLAAAILALSACSESDDILSSFHNDPNAVHITAEVGKASADGFTRSNPLGDAQKQKQFNENDEISVTADGQEAVTYKFNGTEWIPQNSKFLKWESNEMNFTAYYPATYNGGTITQPTEYTDEKSLADADFMSYTGKQSNTNGNTLTLTMQRKMARVVVEIAGFNDQYDKNTPVNSVSICGVTAYKHKDDGKFYALIKPCEAQSSETFLSLNVGENNTETLKRIPAFEAGKSYTYQLTVGKNKVVVTGITVKDWTTGEITGGKTTFTPYVTFSANTTQIFKLKNNGYFPSNIEYSVGTGDWITLKETDVIPFGGDKGILQLRGTNTGGTAINGSAYSTISFDNKDVNVTCTGDIRTLLDYRIYKTVDTQNAKFYGLFYYCKALASAPDLPATTLAEICYYAMFSGCTNLKTAPSLPAETLAKNCYRYMFYGCTSLNTAPSLPATTLAEGCYFNMFQDCTSLTSAPKLSATTLVEGCYSMMFNGCSNLSSVTMLAPSDQIISKTGCCDSWLRNAGTDATSRKLILKDVDAYNALANNIAYLPNDWKKGECNVLDGTPYVTFSANAAQTFKLENHGYFPSNIEYSVGTGDWKTLEANKRIDFGGDLGNLQLRGTENLNGTASDDGSNFSQIIFRNSTKVACTGDIRTLLDYRDFKNVNTSNAKFCNLFMDCTVLTSAPDLPATQLANKCYYYMFIFCTSLTKAPELPAETLASGCYKGMFDGCYRLQEAPELPATTLAPNCYYDMFNGCTNLTSVTMLAPSDQITSKENCCYGWLTDAGTGAKSRTLIVKDEDAYKALVNKGCLPADYWQKGKCTVN
ncbi:MAG: fimbrillin family protein [bacterium]|nr:fimbrillin family protein [bacterium]